MATTGSTTSGVPAHWASDVVLVDGGTVHIRPIDPSDAESLVAFHARLSPETVYRRFFSPKPRLTEKEVERFTTVDHVDRVALVAELGDQLVGVARYDRDHQRPDSAEVAFVVADEHHGRGLGTILLEHLAAAARERGITRFVAETLPMNQQMLGVFRAAGFQERTRLADGVVDIELLIEPTDESRAAIEEREHRADSRSIARLVTPRSVAVIGAGRERGTLGHEAVRNLLRGGFNGPVHPVNPMAGSVASVKAYPTVTDVPDDVDLAVVAVPADEVLDVARQCAEKGVAGLLVLSDVPDPRELRETVRRHGMRLIGPNSVGVVNTAVGLDATVSPFPARPGRIAMQSQSGALGVTLLERANRLDVGVSSFVSVGAKADISGNDLLQYWEDDPSTDVVLLYLESFGNPRKFSRIARRVSRRKPIVAVKSGRSTTADVAVDALFHQTGVIRVDTLNELFDVALVLGSQPLPQGRRVAIISNSGGAATLALDASQGAGLDAGPPRDLDLSAAPADFATALSDAVAADDVDAVLVIAAPSYVANPADVARAIASVDSKGKPLVAAFLAWPEVPALLEAVLPSFASPEPAVRALGRAVSYADWRRRPPGTLPALDGFDGDRARAIVIGHDGWLPPDAVAAVITAAGLDAPCDVGLRLDPLFGPLVWAGRGPDRTYRVVPITDLDAAEFGPLADAVQRVGRLAAAAPEIVEVDLGADPAAIRAEPPAVAPDTYLRRLT